jgi:uncharacterized membrane protein YhaH (DUF805 family)
MNIFAANRISRLPYFLWMLAICVAVSLIQVFAGSHLSRDETSPVMSLVWMLAVGVAAFPIVKRLHDLNKSGWLWLFGLVPILNVFFGIYLLFGKGTEGANDYGNPPEKLLEKIRIGPSSIINRSDNDTFYQQAYEELENRQMDKALWAKIFSQCGGNENKAKAQYITVRVERLAAEKPVLDSQPAKMSLYDQMKKNIENVEKAKSFLALSADCGWPGAMNATPETTFLFINGFPDNEAAKNLLLNLERKNLRELDVAGSRIDVGDMKTPARYVSNSK